MILPVTLNLYRVKLYTHAGTVGARIVVAASSPKEAASVADVWAMDHPHLDRSQITPQFSVSLMESTGKVVVGVYMPGT